jgi:aromatic-L-amino-acid decarboxylase
LTCFLPEKRKIFNFFDGIRPRLPFFVLFPEKRYDEAGKKTMDNEDFRCFGHRFVDWIADYFEKIEGFKVKPEIKPGEIAKILPPTPPTGGEAMDRIFEDFEKIIVPGMTHWQHPGWFAYFPANNSPPSVLAELLTAGLGAQCMVWQTSPAAAELEEVVLDWLRQMIGLPPDFSGVIQDTASTATLCALLTARERVTAFEANESGIRTPLTVYASEEAHSSVDKAVKIAGFGKKNLRKIPTGGDFAMVPGLLEEAVVRDRGEGHVPTCVVATVGTTSSGAVDPLGPVAEICRRHGIWLHVDAAYAGTAAILPEKRWILEGAEEADSLVFNPHKWMLTNFDCSAYFVRNPKILVGTFEIHPEYLKTGLDAQVKNYRDWGIQLGRRFRALKLWFVIRSYGVEGLRAVVREHIRLAGRFKEWLEADRRFEILAPVDLSLVCFRLNDGRGEETLNDLNRRLLERANVSGKIFLTHTTLKGRYTLRLVVGQRTTGERHVREAWEIIRASADELLRK